MAPAGATAPAGTVLAQRRHFLILIFAPSGHWRTTIPVVKRMTATTAGACAFALLMFAAPAHAGDDEYLTELSAWGIEYTSGPEAVRQAHEICADAITGVPKAVVINKMYSEYGFTQSLDYASHWFRLALGNYCPTELFDQPL